MHNPFEPPSGESATPNTPSDSARLENVGRLIVFAIVAVNFAASIGLTGLMFLRTHFIAFAAMLRLILEALLYWQAVVGRTWARMVMILLYLWALVGAVGRGALGSTIGIAQVVLFAMSAALLAFSRSVAAHFER